MRCTEYFIPTEKEIPADAEVISHQLMLRAGLIRKLASGLYTWLPLGLRVLQKVEAIVREELNKVGALEMIMPAVQPAEIWQESGRWEQYGPELLRFHDRHQRDFCFGPTHEEVITDTVRSLVRSYKQLPLNIYQIQTKFRDEIRPRFGVMRAREFLMKDAYSFHLTHDCLAKTYDKMFNAYSAIFTRLGLTFRSVLADTGSIGGNASHEFQVLAETGEDTIFYSNNSPYAANIELAEAVTTEQRPAPSANLEMIDTPNCHTIPEVCQLLKLDVKKTVKTLIVKGAEHALVALVLRGDHELNTIKASKHPWIDDTVEFADPNEIQQALGAPIGSLGPVDLAIPLIVDRSAAVISDFCCGANKAEKHWINVNWERDCTLKEIADLRNVEIGDPSPDGNGQLQMAKGIEVGHIFQLGTKYSHAMKATVLDEKGDANELAMGCYGIGISRVIAAAIEQNHDKRGIIWPEAMAPFQIALLSINAHKSQRLTEACDKLYSELQAAGFEVLYDDRPVRPGVKFSEMDLIGIPHRLVFSERGLDAGEIEYKPRDKEDAQMIKIDSVVPALFTSQPAACS